MTTKSAAQILRELNEIKLPFDDESPESSETNEMHEMHEMHETHETDEVVELKWPEPNVSVDDALLKAFKTFVLRLMLTAMVKPSQVLTAMRRLEALREFPLKKEKQERMLAIAEARLELRRRALDLREAQLKERREAREAALAKATAKAAEKEARAAARVVRSSAIVPKSTQPNTQPNQVLETKSSETICSSKSLVTSPHDLSSPSGM
jgi:hypothetical protein